MLRSLLTRKVGFKADSATALPAREYGPSEDIARVHNGRIDATRTKRGYFYRRQAVVIRNMDQPQRWTLRVVMGAGKAIEKLSYDGVAIDYDACVELGIRPGPCNLKVEVASELSVIKWYWNHRDPGFRLSMRLGLLGAFTGFLGLVPLLW